MKEAPEPRRIEKVFDPIFGNKCVVFKNDVSIVCVDYDSLDRKEVKHNDPAFVILGISSDLVLVRDKNYLTWYNLDLAIVSKINFHLKGKIQTKFIGEDFLLVRNSISEDSWVLTKYDFLREESSWTLENDKSQFLHVHYPYFCHYSNAEPCELKCNSLLTGERFWSYHLDDSLRIFGEIKIIDGCILIPTDNGQIISVDIEDGQKKWNIKAYPYPQIDIRSRIFFTIQAEYDFTVYNTQSGEKIKKIGDWSNSLTYPNLSGTFGGSASVYEDFIVIPNNDTCEVFFLSKGTAKVIDYIKLDVSDQPVREGVRISRSPVYRKGKLFVLDSEGALHVYRKD